MPTSTRPLRSSPTASRAGRLTACDDLFLTDGATRRIHRLNATGGIVWSLLAEPTSDGELAEALRILYPAVPTARVAADLASLLATLRADGLVEVERQD